MAATVTKDFMISQMREKKYPFFVVTDGRDIIANNEDEQSVEAAIELLENVLGNVLDSFVIVKLSEKTRKQINQGGNVKTSYLEYKIQLRPTQGVRGIGSNGSLVDDLIQQNKILTERLHEQKIEMIEANLNRKMDDMRKELTEKPDPMMEIALKGITGLFKDKTQPPVTGLAGADDGAVDEAALARQKKIRFALFRLAKIDKQLDETMTSLADFAEKNPEKYHSMIPLIKTM